MWVIEKGLILRGLSFTLSPSLKRDSNGRKFGTALAKRSDMHGHENSKDQQKPLFQLRVSKSDLSRAAIAVVGLGFIDAGYSGDWSRIGVISKESEELLKVAAFVVVPLCAFLIFSLSKVKRT